MDFIVLDNNFFIKKKMIEGINYLENEEFIRIPDFPDYYISNCGRVYSSKTQRCIGCKNPKTGYMMVSLSKGKRSKTTYIHHLVMKFFGDPRPSSDYEIDHIDRHKDNNNITNLRWLTRQENLENKNEYRKDRKKRLCKKDIIKFNLWYISNKDSLDNLSNEKVAMKFEETTKIPIHSITVRNNRNMWVKDENDRLHRIPDEN